MFVLIHAIKIQIHTFGVKAFAKKKFYLIALKAMAKRRASAKTDKCNDPLRQRRLEDHLRKFVSFMEDPTTGDQHKEEMLDVWWLETKDIISEN